VVEPLAWPDSLAGAIRARFGYYAPSVFAGEELVGAFAKDAACQAAYFYERDDWELFVYVFTQSDNIHHLTGFSRRALEVYRTIDGFVGDVMDRMDGDGTLLVVSDHGFAGYSYGIDLNRYLENLGLLRRDASGGIDHDNTLVFHDVWHLYFNHAGITREALAARGIDVAPGEDPAKRLSRYLQDAARRIESADGRHRVSLELTPLAGGRAGTSPDMIVEGACGRYVVEFLGRVHAHASVFYELRGEQRWWHQRDGIFMAWGDGIRRGYDAGVCNIQDVAPTILYALGLPVADDMDGRVLDEIFERRFRGDRPVYVVDAYPPDMVPDTGAAARESLAKKLRTLGYLSP
jgi:predicted AlkP superfamily phosphohydrolase/phosphomutase